MGTRKGGRERKRKEGERSKEEREKEKERSTTHNSIKLTNRRRNLDGIIYGII